MAGNDDIKIAIELDDHHQKLLELYAANLEITVENAGRFLISQGIVQAYGKHYGIGSDEHRQAAADLGVDIEV